ncbi:MAG TPA: TetR/AcrR family transcriptional regulator [Acidimicrobiales bacterium]|nr:TetR/AcrR family transcriptional regulator [Acidimicrobiales bacterium]
MDGRVRRGEINRQAIVDAALALVAEECTMPTAQAIADRAGVAKRSVFHHFPDLDGLFMEAGDTQANRYWPLLQHPDPEARLDARIVAAVEQRSELFEAIGDVRRVALLHEHRSDALAERIRQSRTALRRHLVLALSPELRALDRSAAEGVHAMASFETWESIRRHQGLSIPVARAAVTSTIESAFERAFSKEF